MREPRGNEYTAYFSVAGELDPDDVTAKLQLQPSRFWRKGDVHPRTQLERKASRWFLDSKLDKTQPLEWHMENVLDQLEVQTEAVRAVAAAEGGVLQLVAYFYSSYPGLSMKTAVVSRLAALSLEIDFDFYYLYSDKREDTN